MISTDQNPDLVHGQLSLVLSDALHTLLKALRISSTAAGNAASAPVEAAIQLFESALDHCSTSEIPRAAGALAGAIEKSQTLNSVQDPIQGLRDMLSVTANTVATLCADNDEYRTRLDEIERQIEQTASFGEGRALRFRLSECLYGLRQAGARQRELMAQALAQLREQLGRVQSGQKLADTAPARDPLTNLEGRESAEQALADAIDRRKAAHAVAFVVGRVHQVNIRFGYATGNQVLLLARDHLASHLRSEDRLFRWSGPTFIALMERGPAQQAIETEVHQIADAHREATVSIGDHAVVIPITFAPLAVPLAQVSDIAELAQKIDRFAGELSHR